MNKIILDNRLPESAKKNLGKYGDLLSIQTNGITYDAISGHPDIFCCKTNDNLIIAPNLPLQIKKTIVDSNIAFIEGEQPIGNKYPETAKYNAVCTDELLIHNFRYTDVMITRNYEDVELIHVDQGYTRCNLIPLPENKFITSDHGIERVLKRYNLDVLFVDPIEIILPGMKHGFIGGCCGIFEDKLFLSGRLKYYSDGEKMKKYVQDAGIEIIELYDGPLFDGGSILFL